MSDLPSTVILALNFSAQLVVHEGSFRKLLANCQAILAQKTDSLREA